ncbi:MAG: type II toxin-antitoxin system VapB family antitoxin [Planctomycetes bacterium]|nr:type II toxin-antitoxin system VapB family antitoxin [Planctomycetota bacterium]
MATNLALDDKLVEKVLELGKHKSKKDAVNAALLEYVQRHCQKEIIKYFGKIEYFENYDYKKARRRK